MAFFWPIEMEDEEILIIKLNVQRQKNDHYQDQQQAHPSPG